jgi:hypothetical protein
MTPKGYLLPEFYSGATELTGRFNEGFLLRRLHPDHGRLAFRLIQESCSIRAQMGPVRDRAIFS